MALKFLDFALGVLTILFSPLIGLGLIVRELTYFGASVRKTFFNA